MLTHCSQYSTSFLANKDHSPLKKHLPFSPTPPSPDLLHKQSLSSPQPVTPLTNPHLPVINLLHCYLDSLASAGFVNRLCLTQNLLLHATVVGLLGCANS